MSLYTCRVNVNGKYEYNESFNTLEEAKTWAIKHARIVETPRTGWDTVYSVSIYEPTPYGIDFANFLPILIISPT